MVKFSFEVPIHHLEDFEDLQDFHFSLSFLYSNIAYRSFMIKQKYLGLKTLWLDNSYNEKLRADDLDELVALAKEIRCDKVIVPDDPNWNTEQTISSYEKACKKLDNFKLITVVSSFDMSVALSVGSGSFHNAYSYWNRMKVPNIDDMLWAKDCHFLGMLGATELIRIKPPSCDTSMPIKLALRDWTWNEWSAKGAPHIYTHEMPDFFNTFMSEKQVKLARQNIIDLKEIVNG